MLPRAHVVTTFSASLARSYRRGASPETVSFPVAAIQLLMRFIYETGEGPMDFVLSPGSVFPIQSRGLRPKALVSSQGDRDGYVQIRSHTDRILYK